MTDLQQVMGMLEEGNPVEEIAEYMSRRKIHLRLGNAPELYETMMNSLAQALENVKALEGYAVQDGSDFQKMRIEDVIERVLQDHRNDLAGIQVETCFEEQEYSFLGNPLKIYDIFQNLVLNAIEAVEETESPIVRIVTRMGDGVHETTVEDNGCGMSEEVKKHVFEPFFTTKELVEGRQRGLGLFNAWRLVAQHGGRVDLETKPGQWTRLHVSLDVSYCGAPSRMSVR
jgi:C4-dicarboxylate-specific signal transduction histidine kinase